MRRDAKLAAVLSAYFLPLLRCTWAVDPAGVTNAKAVDLVAKDLGLPVLGQRGAVTDSPIRGFKWKDHVRLALLNLVYGHMPFEQWYEQRGGLTHLAGLAERQPHTVAMIDLADDGQVRSILQNTQDKPIPANRMLWYVHEREGANWAGVSLLRACYAPWILKHEVMRVHATSHRRWGMGVPVVKAPPGATPGQIEEARRLAAGFRAGDQAGAGMPDGYQFELAGITGSVPDAVAFLQFLNQEMASSALTSILEMGQSRVGARALGDTFLDLFLLSLQAVGDAIGETVTYGDPAMPGIARALTDYNFGEDEPCPRIVATDVGDRHEITAIAIQQLVASGAVQPDDALETYIRDAWSLPARTTPRIPPPGTPGGPPLPAGHGGPGAGGNPPALAPPAPAPALPRPQTGPPGRRGGQPATASAGDMRPLTPVEAAAGMDPEAMRQELEVARDHVLSEWGPVLSAQRQDLADQVTAAVDAGDISGLAQLRPDHDDGSGVLFAAMRLMAGKAASRMLAEAAGQGVIIPVTDVHVDEDRLRQLAQARSAMAAAQLATAASRRALQVVTASAGDDTAREVVTALAGLSPVPLADELMAALHAAANEGRFSVLDAGPAAAYTSSEIMDGNTCGPCSQEDGHEFADLADARAAYPNGGYAGCLGQLRCRGTVVATWGDVTVNLPDVAAPAASADVEARSSWDEHKHPRNPHGPGGGEFVSVPGSGHGHPGSGKSRPSSGGKGRKGKGGPAVTPRKNRPTPPRPSSRPLPPGTISAEQHEQLKRALARANDEIRSYQAKTREMDLLNEELQTAGQQLNREMEKEEKERKHGRIVKLVARIATLIAAGILTWMVAHGMETGWMVELAGGLGPVGVELGIEKAVRAL